MIYLNGQVDVSSPCRSPQPLTHSPSACVCSLCGYEFSVVNILFVCPLFCVPPPLRAELEAFHFRSKLSHESTAVVKIQILNLTAALEVADNLLDFQRNVSFTLIGTFHVRYRG